MANVSPRRGALAAVALALGFAVARSAAGEGARTVAAAALPQPAAPPTTAPAGPAAPRRPLDLPFALPPGPDTWLLGQPYGNTTGAYRQRRTTYGASGGIHFGVDLTAPCGTPVVAVADGVVFSVDAMNFGSAPHNVMIDHPDLGIASFYGHLRDRSPLVAGQAIGRGDPVGVVGDPGLTCRSRPHLHLELRDLAHAKKFNPVTYIEADWDTLALASSLGIGFQRDLDDPRKWQHLDDQPEARVGGPILNDFARPWPPDVR